MENPKIFYVKFKLGKANDNVLPSSFIYSNDKSTIDAWQGAGAKPRTQEDAPASKNPTSIFAELVWSFTIANSKFYRTAPLMLGMRPIFTSLERDSQLRKHAKMWGKPLDSSDEYETYEIPLNQRQEVERRLAKYRALSSGLRDLPQLFAMGLASSFDAYIAQLIRSILITKPDNNIPIRQEYIISRSRRIRLY